MVESMPFILLSDVAQDGQLDFDINIEERHNEFHFLRCFAYRFVGLSDEAFEHKIQRMARIAHLLQSHEQLSPDGILAASFPAVLKRLCSALGSMLRARLTLKVVGALHCWRLAFETDVRDGATARCQSHAMPDEAQWTSE